MRGIRHGPAWDEWIATLEAASDACHDDWTAEHFEPKLGYEPHQQLLLARDDGGPRHLLDGRPVHAGAVLELLAHDGRWLSVRYEWAWDDSPPTAHLALGAPPQALRQGLEPVVSFALPSRAVLRWPPDRKGDR